MGLQLKQRKSAVLLIASLQLEDGEEEI